MSRLLAKNPLFFPRSNSPNVSPPFAKGAGGIFVFRDVAAGDENPPNPLCQRGNRKEAKTRMVAWSEMTDIFSQPLLARGRQVRILRALRQGISRSSE